MGREEEEEEQEQEQEQEEGAVREWRHVGNRGQRYNRESGVPVRCRQRFGKMHSSATVARCNVPLLVIMSNTTSVFVY